jgi:hypothetical protein
MDRLGLFLPWQERREELAFESRVSLIGQEVAWDERKKRLSVRLARREPCMFFRARRASRRG